jgi:hypothetical protein
VYVLIKGSFLVGPIGSTAFFFSKAKLYLPSLALPAALQSELIDVRRCVLGTPPARPTT